MKSCILCIWWKLALKSQYVLNDNALKATKKKEKGIHQPFLLALFEHRQGTFDCSAYNYTFCEIFISLIKSIFLSTSHSFWAVYDAIYFENL